MKRIRALTAEQEALIPVVADEWLGHGLSTAPADREEAERGVAEAYREAGLPPPSTVIWLQSPLAGVLGARIVALAEKAALGYTPFATVNTALVNHARDKVWNRPIGRAWSQVANQVLNEVRSQVAEPLLQPIMRMRQVGNLVRESVASEVAWFTFLSGISAIQPRFDAAEGLQNLAKDDITTLAWDRIEHSVRHQVSAQLWNRIEHSVRNQVSAQLGDRVWGEVWTQVGSLMTAEITSRELGNTRGLSSALWGQHDAGWLAFYDYFRRACSLSQCERLTGLFRVAKSAGWWWSWRDAVIITERPTQLHRDAQLRLHHETGPALLYPDGFGVWAWHGVRVPQELIEGRWSTTDILTCDNLEIRRCAIEKIGWNRFVVDAGLRQVGAPAPDPGNPGHYLVLYDIPESLYNVPIRVLLCDNATPERDGTRRRFGLTVPAAISDPLAAAAWTFDLNPEQYAQLQHAY